MNKSPAAIFPPSFTLLLQEGYLISACLSTGLTQLRSADVQNKGAFYTALFNLSIGLERLLKAILITEHMLNNKLVVPTKQQLKLYGHNVVELYDACEKIGTRRNSPTLRRTSFDPIDLEFLSLLSDFARTTRYHNLDALSSAQVGVDPLLRWARLLDALLNSDVSQKQKKKTLSLANSIADAIDDVTFTVMHGLDQNPMSTSEALSMAGLHKLANPFAVFRLVKILSPLRDLLGDISREAWQLGSSAPAIPLMHEFLDWLFVEREQVLRKRRWP